MKKNTMIITGAVAASMMIGCSGHNSGNAQPAASGDSLPRGIVELRKAVADGDAQAFAAKVIYPLERDYPLHNIEDSAAMVKYYKTLVDKRLHDAIVNSPDSAWGLFGWRGYGLDDGTYLWYDEGVYSVPYESEAEKKLRTRFVKEELMSLPPALRRGYVPVGCFESSEGQVFRIDIAESPEHASTDASYRLCVYASKAKMRSMPTAIFYGTKHVEGTADVPHYDFARKDKTPVSGAGIENAVSVVYYPYSEDGSPLVVSYTPADGQSMDMEVSKAYWLDLLEK